MRQLVKRVRESAFVRHNTIFFVGSLGIGLLNYLFYPAMGHLLHPDSFGEVQVLFSIFAQVGIFLNVLGLLTVNIVANYKDVAWRNRTILELEKLALLLSFLLLVATILAGVPLQHFFKFNSAAPFAILAAAVVVSVPLTFRNAFLRGKQRFGLVSTVGVLAAGGDLLVAILFVLAGWQTTGAIAGLVVAQFLAFCLAAFMARRFGFTESLRNNFFRLPDMKLIFPELKYAALVLTGSLAITGLYSIDSIAVKHFFDARTAGLYAGISTVARIVFFLTGSVAQVLMPAIKLRESMQHNRQTLLKSFALLTGVGGAALLVFTLAPQFVIRILIGQNYLHYAHLLPRLSLVIFIISILNLFIMYHMALRRYAIMLVVIMGIAVTLGLLRMHHQTLQAVIDSLLCGSLTMLALLGVWLGGTRLKKS